MDATPILIESDAKLVGTGRPWAPDEPTGIARLQAQGTSRSIGMMTGRGIGPDAAGGPASHRPVMLREVLLHLAPRERGEFEQVTIDARRVALI
jgi:hypothetical protein